MNEQLQQALAAIIGRTMDGVQAGIDFLSAEIPDVIHQLLMWKLVEAIITTTFCALLIVAIVVIWFKYAGLGEKIDLDGGNYQNHRWTLTHDCDGDLSPHVMATAFLSLLPLIGSSMEGFSALKVALQIFIAPKLYLIEYAASLYNHSPVK